jgi:hypothetical protein
LLNGPLTINDRGKIVKKYLRVRFDRRQIAAAFHKGFRVFHPLKISARGKIYRITGIRRSLPYYGIARRAIGNSYLSYDRSIDLSAVLLKK